MPTKAFQLVDDVSLVRGKHQIGFGANYIRSTLDSISVGAAAGSFAFTGTFTGLGLSDFLLGRPATFNQGQLYTPRGTMNYVGAYVQDAWTVSPNLTINAGLRWDPYLPVHERSRSTSTTSASSSSSAGVRSTVYKNAPVGVIFEGDPGYPGTPSARSICRASRRGCRRRGIRAAMHA